MGVVQPASALWKVQNRSKAQSGNTNTNTNLPKSTDGVWIQSGNTTVKNSKFTRETPWAHSNKS